MTVSLSRPLVSRLTEKFQATVPKPVRQLLGLKQGDSLTFLLDEKTKKVVLRKAEPIDLEFLRSLEPTLSEWSSDNDEEAYRDL